MHANAGMVTALQQAVAHLGSTLEAPLCSSISLNAEITLHGSQKKKKKMHMHVDRTPISNVIAGPSAR